VFVNLQAIWSAHLVVHKAVRRIPSRYPAPPSDWNASDLQSILNFHTFVHLAAQRGAFNPERKNPFSEVAIPRTQHVPKPKRHATLDDVVAMISALDEPAATAVAVAAFTGLRKSEIQGLRWEDLNGDELHVQRTAWRPTHVIEETKTVASKSPVPVIPILARYLAAYRDGNPSNGFIFEGAKKRRPLDLHNLANRVIRSALEQADIPWCGWYGFRRGLVTSLYKLGLDGKTWQSTPTSR
jgi:integrase